MTKVQLIQKLIDDTGLSRAQVKTFLDVLAATVSSTLKTEGKITLPDIVSLKLVLKAAKPERDGVNPFTKEKIRIAAKPESKKVKASPVTSLKEAVEA